MTPVAAILLSLMDEVGEGGTLPDLLCRAAKRQLGASAVGLSVMGADASVELLAGSDQAAADLLAHQLTLGEGPSVEAFRDGRLVQVPFLENEGPGRWPAATETLLREGVRATSAFPLRIGGIRLGVLDVHRSTPGRVADATLAQSLHFADAAVAVLLHLQGLERADPGTRDGAVVEAFASRPEVHQATGMVSVQAGVSLADALLLLRAHAFAQGRDLIDVARDVVARRLDLR